MLLQWMPKRLCETRSVGVPFRIWSLRWEGGGEGGEGEERGSFSDASPPLFLWPPTQTFFWIMSHNSHHAITMSV